MRLLIVGLIFTAMAFPAQLLVFHTPAEILPFFHYQGVYGNNDVLSACVFDEPGTGYLITMTQQEREATSFVRVAEHGSACKIHTFPPSERYEAREIKAQKIIPVGEPLTPTDFTDPR